MKTLTVSTLVLVLATAGAQAQLGGVTEAAGSVRQTTEIGLQSELGADSGLGDLRSGRSLSRIEQARLDRARRDARRAAREAAATSPEMAATGGATIDAAAEQSSQPLSAAARAGATASAGSDADVSSTDLPSLNRPRPVAEVRQAIAPVRAAVETEPLPAPEIAAELAAPAVEAPAPDVRVRSTAPAAVVRDRQTVYVAPPPRPVAHRADRGRTQPVADAETSAPAAAPVASPPPAAPRATGADGLGQVVERGLPLCLAALLILGLILTAREITRPRRNAG